MAVLVELKARFDERNNIVWANAARGGRHPRGLRPGEPQDALQAVPGRAQGDRRHPPLRAHRHRQLQPRSPSQIYTDLGLFTADARIVDDVSEVFNYLTGYSNQRSVPRAAGRAGRPAAGLPGADRARDRARRAPAGRRGIIIKNNAVTDPAMIRTLYRASQAGVPIDLIVRGVCCLRPGIPGISDRIRVRSIVGRFLEHSRIYWFENGGEPEVYIGSADLMERNLDRRVEVLCPVADPELRAAPARRRARRAAAADTDRAWTAARPTAPTCAAPPPRARPPWTRRRCCSRTTRRPGTSASSVQQCTARQSPARPDAASLLPAKRA